MHYSRPPIRKRGEIITFDAVTVGWRGHLDCPLNHLVFELVRAPLPNHNPGHFEVGGYGSDPKRGGGSVDLITEAGHGPALLAWTRHNLHYEPLSETSFTLYSAQTGNTVTVPIQPERFA